MVLNTRFVKRCMSFIPALILAMVAWGLLVYGWYHLIARVFWGDEDY